VSRSRDGDVKFRKIEEAVPLLAELQSTIQQMDPTSVRRQEYDALVDFYSARIFLR